MARYTDEERASILAVLEVNGNNFDLTARQTKVPEQTLRRWRRQAHLNKLVPPKKRHSLIDWKSWHTRSWTPSPAR